MQPLNIDETWWCEDCWEVPKNQCHGEHPTLIQRPALARRFKKVQQTLDSIRPPTVPELELRTDDEILAGLRLQIGPALSCELTLRHADGSTLKAQLELPELRPDMCTQPGRSAAAGAGDSDAHLQLLVRFLAGHLAVNGYLHPAEPPAPLPPPAGPVPPPAPPALPAAPVDCPTATRRDGRVRLVFEGPSSKASMPPPAGPAPPARPPALPAAPLNCPTAASRDIRLFFAEPSCKASVPPPAATATGAGDSNGFPQVAVKEEPQYVPPVARRSASPEEVSLISDEDEWDDGNAGNAHCSPPLSPAPSSPSSSPPKPGTGTPGTPRADLDEDEDKDSGSEMEPHAKQAKPDSSSCSRSTPRTPTPRRWKRAQVNSSEEEEDKEEEEMPRRGRKRAAKRALVARDDDDDSVIENRASSAVRPQRPRRRTSGGGKGGTPTRDTRMATRATSGASASKLTPVKKHVALQEDKREWKRLTEGKKYADAKAFLMSLGDRCGLVYDTLAVDAVCVVDQPQRRRFLAESKFFDPHRSKKLPEMKAFLSQLLDHRYWDGTGRAPEKINLEGKSARFLITTERLFQERVFRLCDKLPVLGLPRGPQVPDAGPERQHGPLETYSVGDTIIQSQTALRFPSVAERLGDAHVHDVPNYDGIYAWFAGATAEEPEREKKLAQLLIDFAKSHEPLSEAKLEAEGLLAAEAEAEAEDLAVAPLTVQDLTRVAFLVMVKEQAAWQSACYCEGREQKLGRAVSFARSMLLLSEGHLATKRVFKKDAAFGVYSGEDPLEKGARMFETKKCCRDVDEKYSQCFGFGGRLTAQRAHLDLLAVYGGESDSSGSDYDFEPDSDSDSSFEESRDFLIATEIVDRVKQKRSVRSRFVKYINE